MSPVLIVLLAVFAVVVGTLYWSIRRLENVVGYLGTKQDAQTDIFRGIVLVLAGDKEHSDVKDVKEQLEQSAKEILDGTIK